MPTIRQNFAEMRDLALLIMADNYRAADKCAAEFAKSGDRAMRHAAAQHLESAERWRKRAAEHGAFIA